MSGRGKPVHPPVANASLDLNGAQFSVLNSMRTGNMIIDMIIALLVPFFFKLIFSDSKQLLLRIYDFLFDRKPSEDECIREISFLSVGSSLTGRDHKNQLLQKAITLYLTEEMRLPFESRAQVSLTAFHDTSVGMGPIDKYNPLARYRLMWQPPENSWIQIEPGLEFQQRTKREGADEDEDDRGNLRPIQREMIIFELKTSKKDGPQQIDRFIERALSWYKQELLKMRDDARYMYTMISKSPSASIVSEMTSTKRGATGADNKGGMPYKRYKLSDQKTFKSLFFPEKESILKLLSDFQQKVRTICWYSTLDVADSCAPQTLYHMDRNFLRAHFTHATVARAGGQVWSGRVPAQAWAAPPRSSRHREDLFDQGPRAAHRAIYHQHSSGSDQHKPTTYGRHARPTHMCPWTGHGSSADIQGCHLRD
mmetsp:Transcript_19462/g.37870  ORF Transcript_19462/g.37870 Transcript_19462/m.37870 type:complete len:424 (+) Transcript_19462:177-1448(+)